MVVYSMGGKGFTIVLVLQLAIQTIVNQEILEINKSRS